MKISCVCPTTAARREWLPKAIRSFQQQTLRPDEFVIVADEGQSLPEDVMAADKRIRAVWIPAGFSIGEKRNFGALNATGSVILHFDDDDFSLPTRVEDQIHGLTISGKAVTGYHSIKFTDGAQWWKYRGSPNWAFDTSLCYLRNFWIQHQFDEINDGLEASFRQAAIRLGKFISVDGTEQMYATIHPDNTGARVIQGDMWEELASA